MLDLPKEELTFSPVSSPSRCSMVLVGTWTNSPSSGHNCAVKHLTTHIQGARQCWAWQTSSRQHSSPESLVQGGLQQWALLGWGEGGIINLLAVSFGD